MILRKPTSAWVMIVRNDTDWFLDREGKWSFQQVADPAYHAMLLGRHDGRRMAVGFAKLLKEQEVERLSYFERAPIPGKQKGKLQRKQEAERKPEQKVTPQQTLDSRYRASSNSPGDALFLLLGLAGEQSRLYAKHSELCARLASPATWPWPLVSRSKAKDFALGYICHTLGEYLRKRRKRNQKDRIWEDVLQLLLHCGHILPSNWGADDAKHAALSYREAALRYRKAMQRQSRAIAAAKPAAPRRKPRAKRRQGTPTPQVPVARVVE